MDYRSVQFWCMWLPMYLISAFSSLHAFPRLPSHTVTVAPSPHSQGLPLAPDIIPALPVPCSRLLLQIRSLKRAASDALSWCVSWLLLFLTWADSDLGWFWLTWFLECLDSSLALPNKYDSWCQNLLTHNFPPMSIGHEDQSKHEQTQSTTWPNVFLPPQCLTTQN